MNPKPSACAWRADQLPECFAALCYRAKLTRTPVPQRSAPGAGSDPARWLAETAQSAGCEAVTLESKFSELQSNLRTAYPAILALEDNTFLAIIGFRRHRLQILTPNDRVVGLPIDTVCDAIPIPHQRAHADGVDQLLEWAGIGPTRRGAARTFLLNQHVSDKRFHRCWILRAGPRAGVWQWLIDTGAPHQATALLLAHIAQYLVWVASWALLGSLSFSGHLERGWLFAWSLLLATLVPCRVLGTWLQGCLAISVGGQMKRRLLLGALRLHPEEVRTQGIGQFLGQALEAETLETFALGGGIASLLACVDLLVAGCILGKLAWLLAAWFLLAVLIGARFLRRFESWSSSRLGMTHRLVESLVGHRTRLLQEDPDHWHDSEDDSLNEYLQSSQQVDRIGAALVAGLPRGWLVVALAFLAPGLLTAHGITSDPQSGIAVLLGGSLLAYTAFDRLMASFSEIAVSWVAWKRIRPLFSAGSRSNSVSSTGASSSLRALPLATGLAQRPNRHTTPPLLQADKLAFRYTRRPAPILSDCSLTIAEGDRILLEGSSGGGKTTLASLLSALRTPDSGLLLLQGLDLHSLGAEAWRERIVNVPQFHENHILTETLAFNLLFGKRWPASPADFEEAEAVCRGLGLGPLLDRMPAGLLQLLGDGGWQLSHGERSRIFIARALLQDPKLLILDESFGALDPENLQLSLEYTRDRAETLLVIAHP